MTIWRRLGVLPLVAALTAAFAFFGAPRGAHASYSICRTDPVITLSNGTTVTLEADATIDPDQLQDVTYTLHIPTGLSLQSIQYDAQYGSLESVTVVADAIANHYWATLRVDTTSGWGFVQATLTRPNGTVTKGFGLTGLPTIVGW
jgi:hypothetical protein